MPVYSDYRKPVIKKLPRCKAGHFMLCSKKPDCNNCGLVILKKRDAK